MKKKVGRPKKVDYTPSVSIDMNYDLTNQVLFVKKQLGVALTNSELESLANAMLNTYGITVQITECTKKIPFYKRIINWFKGLKK